MSLQAAGFFAVCTALLSHNAFAEDGYRLWMRYDELPTAVAYRTSIKSVAVEGNSATFAAIRLELAEGLSGLLGEKVPVADSITRETSTIVGTPSSSATVRSLKLDQDLARLGPEGFIIRNARLQGR
ncbi:MAG TPA: alpha-glucuronidase family glycosyl hydrolase, partial [Pyrinomonadaceae bacterium]|nr:alpha-glucuronidase family glycosyl hydrolase [Pyrinomonadaceae bacterium]